jgi:hypothetical protein
MAAGSVTEHFLHSLRKDLLHSLLPTKMGLRYLMQTLQELPSSGRELLHSLFPNNINASELVDSHFPHLPAPHQMQVQQPATSQLQEEPFSLVNLVHLVQNFPLINSNSNRNSSSNSNSNISILQSLQLPPILLALVVLVVGLTLLFVTWTYSRFISYNGLPQDMPWADGRKSPWSRMALSFRSFFSHREVIQEGYNKVCFCQKPFFFCLLVPYTYEALCLVFQS